jgi:hypothetical protein
MICVSPRSIMKNGYQRKEIRLALKVQDSQPFGATFVLPIMLAEWGIGEFPDSGDKAQWIEEAFGIMKSRFPRLKAAVFWSERWQNDDGTWTTTIAPVIYISGDICAELVRLTTYSHNTRVFRRSKNTLSFPNDHTYYAATAGGGK